MVFWHSPKAVAMVVWFRLLKAVDEKYRRKCWNAGVLCDCVYAPITHPSVDQMCAELIRSKAV